MAGAPTVSLTINGSDETAYLRADKGVTITRGRADEESQVAPGRMSLTLDNTTERFNFDASTRTPGQSVSLACNGVQRFMGTVDGWPVTWEGVTPLVSLGASDALKVYAQRAANKTIGGAWDIYRAAVLTYSASSFLVSPFTAPTVPLVQPDNGNVGGKFTTWPVYDESGALSATYGRWSMREQSASSTGFVAANIAAPNDIGNVATLTIPGGVNVWYGGNYLGESYPYGRVAGGWFRVASTSTGGVLYFGQGSGVASSVISMTASANGVTLSAYEGTYASRTWSLSAGGSAVPFDTWFHLGMVRNASNLIDYYLNGVKFGTGTSTALWPFTGIFSIVSAGQTFVVSVAHFATASVTSAQGEGMLGHIYAAGAGYGSELADKRILRCLRRAGIPNNYPLATGTRVLSPMAAGPQGIAQVIADSVASEGGLWWADTSGNLRFSNAATRVGASVALTLDADDISPGFQVDVDDSKVANVVTYTRTSAGAVVETLTVTDATSVALYGERTASKSFGLQQSPDFANAAGDHFASSRTVNMRAPNITLDLMTLPSATVTAALALDIGSLIAVTNLPTGAGFTTCTLFVEGFVETIGIDQWELRLNTSPAFVGTAGKFGSGTFDNAKFGV